MREEDREDPRLSGPGENLVGVYHGKPCNARRDSAGESWLLDYLDEVIRLPTLQACADHVAKRHGVKRVHSFRIWPQIGGHVMAQEILTRFDNSKCRTCKARLPKGTRVHWAHKEGVTCMPCVAKRAATPAPAPTPAIEVEAAKLEGFKLEEETPVTTTPATKPTPAPAPAVPPDAAGAALRALLGIDALLASAAKAGADSVLESIRPQVELLVQAGLERIDRPRTVRIETPKVTIEPAKGEVQHPKFEQLARWISSGVRRIWITGEAGTGKTYAAERIAKALGYPLHVAAPGATEYDHLGYRDAHGTYQDTAFYRWAADPDEHAVLLLDEIDRNAVNALQALNAGLANGIGAFPHRQVPIAATKIVIGTANTMGEGPSLRYVGCLAQDGSVIDRFKATMHWDLHEPTERAIAIKEYPYDTTPKAIDASVRVRRNLEGSKSDLAWGPRRTYAVCELAAAGESLRDACLYAGLSRLAQVDQERALQGVK